MTNPNTPPLRRRPSAAAVRLARPVLVAGCIWAATTSALAADGRVVGRVSDAATQAALPGAEVTVAGSSARAVTGPDGSFTLSLPPGEYQLSSYYLGYPAQTIPVVVADGATAPAKFTLGSSEVVTLDTFTVEGSREGQARALNQQRTSQNLVNIVSADLAGQFPDKTIADAVKRLPGVTVETDTDTGGSEGRYITIRGMNADFNAVSVNGMRASVSDFSGLSRRVPLDVVSAKSADQIEVTKALRPDQDGDGIGGAVNIVTRSPFDREGAYAFAEAAATYSALLEDYSDDYPYDNPGYEASAGGSFTFGEKKQFGLSVSANTRDRAFVKQRVSSLGWAADGGPGGAYYPIAVVFQNFFDDVSAQGLNGTFEWRPSEITRLRLDASYSLRDTERGRQRTQVGFIDGGTGTVDGDTYATYTSTGRINRNVRQFFEKQELSNLVFRGETQLDAWKLDYFAGANRGSFDGDPDKDITATFRTSSFAKTLTQNGYFPTISGATYDGRVNDPSRYFFNSIDRGTSFVTDDELAGGLDLKRDASLSGGEGFIKFGAKSRLFDRDFESRARRLRVATGQVNDWALDGFAGRPAIGSSLASYGSDRIVNGTYDPGFYIDPERVRHYADRLEADGFLVEAPDNALRSRARTYEAEEHIHAAYLMGEQTWNQFTALAGARLEYTDVSFEGADARTNSSGDVIVADPYGEASNDYYSLLPGLHLRYAQKKDLVYRFAITRSIARPRLSDLNPGIFQDGESAFSGGDGFVDIIDKGNIDLRPTKATNLDLGVEYYFAAASTLSFGLFFKDMTDNVYQGYLFNDPSFPSTPGNRRMVRTSLNAESAWVRGFELGYDQQLTFLPSPFDGLGAFFNYTYADSQVKTGLAQYADVDLPLFNQVEDTINVGLFYEKKGFRARAAVLYRSESLLGLAVDEDFRDYDSNLSRYLDSTVTLDLTTSYRFAKDWTVFVEFSNLLNEPGRAYDGSESRIDYNEFTDWSATLGLRWNL